jgi:hypothetical protein
VRSRAYCIARLEMRIGPSRNRSSYETRRFSGASSSRTISVRRVVNDLPPKDRDITPPTQLAISALR